MIDKAIISLRPGAKWVLLGDSYEGLDWQDTVQTKPTKEEVNAEVTRLIVEESKNAYKNQRLTEYPSYAEQFDLLYHGGYDAWKAKIKEIKDKYPKL